MHTVENASLGIKILLQNPKLIEEVIFRQIKYFKASTIISDL